MDRPNLGTVFERRFALDNIARAIEVALERDDVGLLDIHEIIQETLEDCDE